MTTPNTAPAEQTIGDLMAILFLRIQLHKALERDDREEITRLNTAIAELS